MSRLLPETSPLPCPSCQRRHRYRHAVVVLLHPLSMDRVVVPLLVRNRGSSARTSAIKRTYLQRAQSDFWRGPPRASSDFRQGPLRVRGLMTTTQACTDLWRGPMRTTWGRELGWTSDEDNASLRGPPTKKTRGRELGDLRRGPPTTCMTRTGSRGEASKGTSLVPHGNDPNRVPTEPFYWAVGDLAEPG